MLCVCVCVHACSCVCVRRVSVPIGHTRTTHTTHGTTRAHTHNVFGFYGNDPSAGSPTETLLRLLLPLNGKV